MFKDPIAPRKINKQVKTPLPFWSFEAPSYDNRNMISAGTDYGTGFNQPVGSHGSAKMSDDIPIKTQRHLLNDKEAY